MLAASASKMLPLSVETSVDASVIGAVGTGQESDTMLSTSSPNSYNNIVSHSLVHNHSARIARTGHHHHHHISRGGRKPAKSPDLIELSDADKQSPVSGLEDDSSPGVTTDADSEDPYCDTESPTPTNSAVNVDPKSYWQGVEEQRELLATEGEDEDDEEEDTRLNEDDDDDDRRGDIELVEIDSSDSEVGTSNNPTSDSDNSNLSCENDEDIDEEELWKINTDQLSYYKAQFKTLQPDPNGLIGGSQAKSFFEKSRLPTAELSHIWQLSDVTKDGALSLNEFCTAMHLVVLRRNKIPLPKHLPPILDPVVQLIESAAAPPPTAAVAASVPVVVAAVTVPTVLPLPDEPKELPIVSSTNVSASSSAVHAPLSSSTVVVDGGIGAAQHWTKFVDSPTGSVASPGPQPVNFDFKRAQVEQDPRILHPVALRLTPESQLHQQGDGGGGQSSGAVSLPPAHTGSNTLGNSLVSAAGVSAMGKKEPPPPPPPRPYRGHARSSSLDLNQLGRGAVAPPPAVPPRVSPSMGSPRKEPNDQQQQVNSSNQGSTGAFQIYRRPAVPVAATAVPASPESRKTGSTKGLSSVISDHQRRGEALRKQQNLLTKTLFDIQEEKNHLEMRLEKISLTDSQ